MAYIVCLAIKNREGFLIAGVKSPVAFQRGGASPVPRLANYSACRFAGK
jgi:hypothetical protein